LGCTVGELEARLSSSEFSEWLAYNDLEPIGPQRADLNAGLIASVIANVGLRPKHLYSAADFMPVYDRPDPKPEEHWRQQQAAFKTLMAAQKKNKAERRKK
jgi:hypothetical protein